MGNEHFRAVSKDTKMRFNIKNEIPFRRMTIMGHRDNVLTVASNKQEYGRWPRFVVIEDGNKHITRTFEFHHLRFRRGLERKFYKSKAAYTEVF